MDDLISRQEAIDAIGKDIMGGLNYEAILRRLPSGQKHGKWIKYNDGSHVCSACGDWWGTEEGAEVIEYYFCPYCGAKMEASDG